MTGMRKRVTVGFLSIVCLLFFSGMVSFVELSRLSRDTGDILEANRRNIELAKAMLDAAHEQNIALIHLTAFGDRSYDSLCRAAMEQLEQTLQVARQEALDKSFLDSIAFATTELRILTDNYLAFGFGEDSTLSQEEITSEVIDSLAAVMAEAMIASPDHTEILNEVAIEDTSAGERWYNTVYEGQYIKLTGAIKNYMTSTQSSLAPRAEQMKKNAYRAVAPVLISLAVMIAIVLMFYYFTMLYCINPILQINHSLGEYLSYKMPFQVSGYIRDEVQALKEKIDTLIAMSKQ